MKSKVTTRIYQKQKSKVCLDLNYFYLIKQSLYRAIKVTLKRNILSPKIKPIYS